MKLATYDEAEALNTLTAQRTSNMMSGKLGQILVVDDEVELKNALVEMLNVQGYDALGCASGTEALSALRKQNFDVLLSDLMMSGMDGVALVRTALEIDQHLVCIIMTGQGTIQTAVDAMKVGAFDYVLKPFRLQALLPVLTRAIDVRRLRQENLQLRETVAMYELCQTIEFTLDRQTLLNKLADAALQQSEADELSILLLTADGSELYVAAVRGENRTRLLDERIPLERGISSWVARERTPLLLRGRVNDARFTAMWPRTDIRSAISVPLQVAGKLVGIINVNNVNSPRPFTLGQMKALTILASTAAAALDSTSLYERVRQAEEKYRSIFENAVEGVFQTTLEGQFITVNPSLARILGYDSPEEVILMITDITHQLYVEPERRAEAARIQEVGGILHDLEFEAYRKDGEKIWLSLNRRSVRDENGVEIYREGTVEDITERKQAEEELLQSEQRYRLLFKRNPQPMWVFDLETLAFLEVNDAAIHHYGYTREEFLAMTIKDIRPAEDIPKLLDNVSRAMPQHEEAGIWKHKKKDGTITFVEITTHELTFYGRPAQIVLAYDVTERRFLEEQFRQSQKLEAVGQLAGGVAHDFNNLLTVITGYSELSLRGLDKDTPLYSNLEEIKKAGESAATLTRQLLAFSRKQVLQPKVLQLNVIVNDVNKMLQRLIGEDIDLLTVLEPSLGQIKADPGQIEQVILNLAVNARDAMPQGGRLSIETTNVYLDEQYARRHTAIQPGHYVMLAVSDTGCGIDAEIQVRMFEPFFTTKEHGKGTGLGLSTVYGIVKQSDGNIWVYSEVGKGTTFKVYLPRVDEGAQEYKRSAETEKALQGTETILLAEDEDIVRKLARQVLEMYGYQVLEAANGDAALLICERYTEPIHLLITDVVMPEMSGRELAERWSQLCPEMRVLFMSGYTDDAIVHQGVLDAGANFIQKPFSPDALAGKVREVLDRPGKT
jgi:two-component system cell cycle sensor histidine kinase/response regulator CckA